MGRRWIARLVLAVAVLLGLGSSASAPRRTLAAPALPAARLAYTDANNRLHIAGADGSGDRIVPTAAPVYAPRWSPAGGGIVVSEVQAVDPYKSRLLMIDPGSGAARELVAPEARIPDLAQYWSYTSPRWTPDGGAVLYHKSGGNRTAHELARVEAAGGAPRTLTDIPLPSGFDVAPTDGRIALAANNFAEEGQGGHLYLLDPEGGNGREIATERGVEYSSPVWTADGRAIAFMEQRGGATTRTLLLLNPDTGERRALGTVPRGSSYAFSPDGGWLALSYGDTKRLVLVNLADFGDQRPIGMGSAPAWEMGAARRCFGETGHCIGGRFLAYWQAHGGLAINGYPISGEFTQTLEDGQPYTVQYFERVRLEQHPANRPPYDVLLGQFGRRLHPAEPAVASRDGYVFVAETGHNVRPRFQDYWQANGGLATFGYPISEEFEETLEDGRPYLVQYFERARFEYHPENAAPFDVLLGQFGRRIYAESRR